jgi:hypothetical protein
MTFGDEPRRREGNLYFIGTESRGQQSDGKASESERVALQAQPGVAT